MELAKSDIKKPEICVHCGVQSQCSYLEEVEIWICKKCWNIKRRSHRKFNKRHALRKGHPNYKKLHPWPKGKSITVAHLNEPGEISEFIEVFSYYETSFTINKKRRRSKKADKSSDPPTAPVTTLAE